MDGTLMLARNGHISGVLRTLRDGVKNTCHMVTVLINDASEFDSSVGYQTVTSLIRSFETLPNALGSNYTLWWHTAYLDFVAPWIGTTVSFAIPHGQIK